MITEDYVSFETAKLLKEKGFDETVNHCYDLYSFEFIPHCAKHGGQINAPTLQMAMKWLREIHHIHIQAFRYPAKVKIEVGKPEYSKSWFYKYTCLTELEDVDTDFFGKEEFETCEEAIDGAIKYCLENLI